MLFVLSISLSFNIVDKSSEVRTLTSELDLAKSIIEMYRSNESKYNYVIGTKYNAESSQCDDSPLITADNSKIDLRKLNRHELKWIAISRDLKKQFDFGDTVIVECDNPRLNGEWIVKDVMNKRFTKRIDFLVPRKDKYNFHQPTAFRIRKK